jgi:hypothetical protein
MYLRFIEQHLRSVLAVVQAMWIKKKHQNRLPLLKTPFVIGRRLADE